MCTHGEDHSVVSPRPRPRPTCHDHPAPAAPPTMHQRITPHPRHTAHATRHTRSRIFPPRPSLGPRGTRPRHAHAPWCTGLDSTQISPCRTTPSCKHLEHLPFWSAVGSLTSRAGGLRAHPAGQMIRIGCHRDDGRNPLRSHLTRKKLPGTQVCVSHERVVPRRHLTSVPRPPIPRWCPVRACLFFAFLTPTY